LRPLAASWMGEAADSWNAAAADMRAMLADLRDLATTAHNNHAAAVRTNVSIWRG
jgi:hypothetical protein